VDVEALYCFLYKLQRVHQISNCSIHHHKFIFLDHRNPFVGGIHMWQSKCFFLYRLDFALFCRANWICLGANDRTWNYVGARPACDLAFAGYSTCCRVSEWCEDGAHWCCFPSSARFDHSRCQSSQFMLVLVEKLLWGCEVVVLTAVFWTCVFASWTHHMFADSLWSSVSWEIMKWVAECFTDTSQPSQNIEDLAVMVMCTSSFSISRNIDEVWKLWDLM